MTDYILSDSSCKKYEYGNPNYFPNPQVAFYFLMKSDGSGAPKTKKKKKAKSSSSSSNKEKSS